VTKNYTGKIDFRVYGVFEKFTVPYRGKADAFENATYTDSGEKLKDVGIFLTNRPIRHDSEFAVSANYPKVFGYNFLKSNLHYRGKPRGKELSCPLHTVTDLDSSTP
ncbi:hypothetical protein AVEN_206357-1, partial [Araneus ventricosus]